MESINKSSVVVGLQILTQNSQRQSNVVIKSAMKLNQSNSRSLSLQTRPIDSCFLKTCFLCSKKLCPNKDVYMYRGDQGFCSVECRNKQIVLDEMRELETSTKQKVASYRRHCCTTGRHETRVLLEDLRRRRNPLPCRKNGAIVSFS